MRLIGKKHWLDNADSWICPICGFETGSLAKYEGCKCPKCGFQDDKDKLEQEPTTKNDCAEQNGCITCSLDDGDDCCRKLFEESMREPTTKNNLGVDCISRVEALNCLKATELKKFDWIIDAREKISKLPSVTPQEPRWISDSDGNLPDKNGLYLVTYDYKPTNQHEVIIARFSIPENEDDDEFRWYDETDIEITLGVTAWMPLPKPYREGEE